MVEPPAPNTEACWTYGLVFDPTSPCPATRADQLPNTDTCGWSNTSTRWEQFHQAFETQLRAQLNQGVSFCAVPARSSHVTCDMTHATLHWGRRVPHIAPIRSLGPRAPTCGRCAPSTLRQSARRAPWCLPTPRCAASPGARNDGCVAQRWQRRGTVQGRLL